MNILFFLTPKAEVVFIHDVDNLKTAMDMLTKDRYHSLPILNDKGYYLGTITEGDVLRVVRDKIDAMTADALEKIQVTEVPRFRDNAAVRIDADMEDLYGKIEQQSFVPVLDDQKFFIGIVTRKDVFRYLRKKVSEIPTG